MKKYVIVNGKDLYFMQANSIGEVSNRALTNCDINKEIIIRQIENIEVLDKVSFKQNKVKIN